MTVFSKKATVRIEAKDKKNPTREIQVFLNTEQFKGISCIMLKDKSPYDNSIDVEFICSNVTPTPGEAKTMEDIDKLLSRLNVAADLKNHKNDPLNANNHLLEIMTVLDNPNIDDKLRSKATLKHKQSVSKEQIKNINEDFERRNKALSDTSPTATGNSQRLKTIDENKDTFEIGEIERE